MCDRVHSREFLEYLIGRVSANRNIKSGVFFVDTQVVGTGNLNLIPTPLYTSCRDFGETTHYSACDGGHRGRSTP